MSTSFGRYTLVRRVGTGGMAEIWKARVQGPQGFQKELAIKKVLPHLAEDAEFIQMFVEEAKLVAGLVHPNIVQVFDFGQVGKQDYFIAMEYVPGSNLAQVIRRLGERRARMPLEVALYVVLEACKGLGYAHARTDNLGNPLGIVHRDVSPQNILVSYGGEVKVTDFGIARVESAISHTADGHVRGKLAYMSPEQAHTQPLDNRSDLFSLGVVFYELVTGRRLFTGGSSSEVYARVTSFKLVEEAELAGLPEEVRLIVRTVLQADPAERYHDAMQMEAALAHALGPDAIVQARHALASIVQRLFSDERKAETESVEIPQREGAVPAEDPLAAATHVAATQPAASAGSAGSVAASAGSPSAIPHEPRRTPTNPSGLTLARSGVSAVKPVSLPAAQAAPPPRRALRGGFYAAIASVLFALIAAAFFAGRWFPGNGGIDVTAPTSVPTPPLPPESPSASAADADATPASTEQTPAPTATAAPASTRVILAPTPVHTRAPRPVAVEKARLSVNARPWVQVYVDGKLVATETPLRRLSLAPGKHVIRFANPAAHFSTESTVEFGSGAEKSFFVDVKAGTVRPD